MSRRGLTKQFRFALTDRDRELLEMIRDFHGVSMAGAIRQAIRYAAREIGINSKPAPEDALSKL